MCFVRLRHSSGLRLLSAFAGERLIDLLSLLPGTKLQRSGWKENAQLEASACLWVEVCPSTWSVRAHSFKSAHNLLFQSGNTQTAQQLLRQHKSAIAPSEAILLTKASHRMSFTEMRLQLHYAHHQLSILIGFGSGSWSRASRLGGSSIFLEDIGAACPALTF